MSKLTLICMIIGAFIFLAGCGETDTGLGESPFIGGSQGVVAEFEALGAEESGVYTIFEDETFPIQILLNNKGEEKIAPGDARVEIHGVLLSDLSGIAGGNLTNNEEIEGISKINKNGGKFTIDFGSEVGYIPEIRGDFVPLDIYAWYTYKYKTTVSVPNACFKEDVRDIGVCEVKGSKSSFSSAAPIQVTSVTENQAGSGKISLTFAVKNVGGGDSTIPGQEFSTIYDKITYRITPESEAAKWKCASVGKENEARFTENTVDIVCTLRNQLEDGAKYTKEVLLEIDYDYKDFVHELLRIKTAE